MVSAVLRCWLIVCLYPITYAILENFSFISVVFFIVTILSEKVRAQCFHRPNLNHHLNNEFVYQYAISIGNIKTLQVEWELVLSESMICLCASTVLIFRYPLTLVFCVCNICWRVSLVHRLVWFGNCIICPFAIYDFWLPLWYRQTFLVGLWTITIYFDWLIWRAAHMYMFV